MHVRHNFGAGVSAFEGVRGSLFFDGYKVFSPVCLPPREKFDIVPRKNRGKRVFRLDDRMMKGRKINKKRNNKLIARGDFD